jgi:hypothetical protein
MNSLLHTASLLFRAMLIVVVSASSSGLVASERAVAGPPRAHKFNFSMGGFVLQNIRTSMRLDASGGQVGDIVCRLRKDIGW